MLDIIIKGDEYYDSSEECFKYTSDILITLEHSLVSLSKWESKWKKPFISQHSQHKKSNDETLDYIRCMVINDIDLSVLNRLSDENINSILSYIEDPMTATTIRQEPGRKSRDIITSEVIYYWMITQNIPFECQYWHLNRLLTLINVCNAKNAPSKKMSTSDTLRRNKALNDARRKSSGHAG